MYEENTVEQRWPRPKSIDSSLNSSCKKLTNLKCVDIVGCDILKKDEDSIRAGRVEFGLKPCTAPNTLPLLLHALSLTNVHLEELGLHDFRSRIPLKLLAGHPGSTGDLDEIYGEMQNHGSMLEHFAHKWTDGSLTCLDSSMRKLSVSSVLDGFRDFLPRWQIRGFRQLMHHSSVVEELNLKFYLLNDDSYYKDYPYPHLHALIPRSLVLPVLSVLSLDGFKSDSRRLVAFFLRFATTLVEVTLGRIQLFDYSTMIVDPHGNWFRVLQSLRDVPFRSLKRFWVGTGCEDICTSRHVADFLMKRTNHHPARQGWHRLGPLPEPMFIDES